MQAHQSRRPTAEDVARASGVSRATVSYVLNDTRGQTIPATTRARVTDAADALGYVPSASARALARGSTNVVVIDLSDIPYGELVARYARDLASAFASRGFVPIIDQLSRGSSDHSLLLALSRTVAPAAVVTAGELPADVRTRLEQSGVSRIAALAPGPDGIATRMAAAASEQIAYLIDRGHRRIGYVGTADPALAALNRHRLRGAEVASAALGADLRVMDDVPSAPGALRAALDDGITAVAAYNDEVAIAVLGAAARLGVGVPGALAVIGIDDLPLSASTFPSLTTITESADGPASLDDFVEGVLLGRPSAPEVARSLRVVRRESA